MIDSFTREYRFLSNFCINPIVINDGELCIDNVIMPGGEYPTAEHLYQAAKTSDFEMQCDIRDAATAGAAKRLGNKVPLIPHWEHIKVKVMAQILALKFSDEGLAQMLIDTEDHFLVENNTWGDTFWGVYRGRGRNILGHLLMNQREELKKIKI